MPQNPYDSEDLPQIISTSNDKTINKPCDIYTHLYLYTKNLFNELLSFYPNITDYDNYLETIAEIIKRCKVLITNEKSKEIKELFKTLENEKYHYLMKGKRNSHLQYYFKLFIRIFN